MDGADSGSGSSSSDESESEAEAEGPLTPQDLSAEDELLKQKIQAALAATGTGAEDMDVDVEDQLLGDEDMVQFDDKLAEIFRHRQELKSAKKNTKQQVLHFKFRVLDLLDIFLKRESGNAMVVLLFGPMQDMLLATARSEDDAELHQKLVSLIKNKLCKLKDLPATLDGEEGFAVLDRLHESLRRTPNTAIGCVLSLMSVQVAKMLLHAASGSAVTAVGLVGCEELAR
jgi:DNA polymerase phi